MMENVDIKGVYIWYYNICKREVWLIAHSLEANQTDDNMMLGNYIHENSYLREKKEISFGNCKFDIVKKKNGQIIIGEIKKTSKYFTSAELQLKFYLYQLNKANVKASGMLMFPEEKKNISVKLENEDIDYLENVVKEIINIIELEIPPKPNKSAFCKKCAYSEFCWS